MRRAVRNLIPSDGKATAVFRAKERALRDTNPSEAAYGVGMLERIEDYLGLDTPGKVRAAKAEIETEQA